ncbi:LLM class flavin-dependent oxidoreductase [Streptomyces sp. NPDC102364]|uniref:LLM class flavin-dependent oxidoreductase n=1 Tax=Streptomyces sp. NPDC102364 TaxID=3366161 RepID=UPI003829B0FC
MTEFGMPWPGAEAGKEAEAAGSAAFCTGEFADHDAYVTVAEMAFNTERAQVGSAIAYAFSRTPFAHAAAVRSLWAQAPGRVFVGLGSGAYAINRDWCGVEADRPVARMAELIAAVRAWLHAENGEKVGFEGEFYRISARVKAPVLGRIDAPVLLAGFQKRMATLAGKGADGVIGHGLFTDAWWDDVVRPAVEQGAREADHDARPLEHGWLLTAIDDSDPDRAVTDMRRMIAFYLTVRTYDAYAAHHGWTAQVEKIREAFADGRTDDMARAVTDDMVEAIGLCGTTADVRSALRRRRRSLARDVTYLAPPSFMVSPRRRGAYARASLPLLNAGQGDPS